MEKNLKDAEQFLDTYLGGNRNVSTLTWNHWIECLRDYSDYQARQQPRLTQILQLCDNLPKEANYFGTVDKIKLLCQ